MMCPHLCTFYYNTELVCFHCGQMTPPDPATRVNLTDNLRPPFEIWAELVNLDKENITQAATADVMVGNIMRGTTS